MHWTDRFRSATFVFKIRNINLSDLLRMLCADNPSWRIKNGKYFPSMNKIAKYVREKRHDWEQ